LSLLNSFKDILIQPFVANRAIVTLNVGVLLWLARLDILDVDGVDEGLFQQLKNNIDTAPVDEKLKPILKYIRKLTLSPSQMTDEDAKACYRAGWNEEDLTIAISICAAWSFFNRMILGHGIDRKWDDQVFRDRGAPEQMSNGYQDYYKKMVANGMADTSGPKHLAPPPV